VYKNKEYINNIYIYIYINIKTNIYKCKRIYECKYVIIPMICNVNRLARRDARCDHAFVA